MKGLKTSTGNDLLNASIRICSGLQPGSYDPTPALQKFVESNRRPNQSQRKPYKPRQKIKKVDTLMDTLSGEDLESDMLEKGVRDSQ